MSYMVWGEDEAWCVDCEQLADDCPCHNDDDPDNCDCEDCQIASGEAKDESA